MSKPDTWMPLYIGDYVADTMHLTTEEHGAYLLLLMTAWNRGGKVPNNDAQLALICRAERKAWSRLRDVVLAFFEVDGEFLVQPRLTKEYEKAVRLNAKQKANGAKGGRPKRTQTESQSAAQQGTQEKPVGFFWDSPNHIPDETPSPSPNTSVANATDGPPVLTVPAADDSSLTRRSFEDMTKAELWGAGKSLLASAGLPVAQCGSFVGKLVKDYGEQIVVDAVRAAVVAQPADPLEYLKATCLHAVGKRVRTGRMPAPENFDAVDYGEGGLL